MPISKSSLSLKEYSGSNAARDVSIRKGSHELVSDSQVQSYITVEYDQKWWVALVMEVYLESH